MMRGVSPDGENLYPSFPYTSYARMSDGDLADLWAFMQTLPAVDNDPGPHRLGFPFNIRRGVGLWKLLYADESWVVKVDETNDRLVRGRYLVEALGHCGECHTPRDFAGGVKRDMWLAGAPNPDGKGRIPNITPGGTIADWSEGDIAYYLESGFTPDFDSVGGSMVDVQENMAKTPRLRPRSHRRLPKGHPRALGRVTERFRSQAIEYHQFQLSCGFLFLPAGPLKSQERQA